MAIREYVGARYVPRFTGLYDVTQIYDALDVVDNGSGTSYIARKTVPAGTPLTNTDYWFIYGASSGAILDLQSRMDNVEEELVTLTGDKYIFIGDSYSLPSFYASDNWIDTMISDLGLSSGDCYIARMGAIGFLNLQNPDDNFLTMLQSIVMSADDAAKVKHIIVCGGANDAGGTINNIVGAIQAFISYAKTNYPNADIHIGCIGRSQNNLNDVKCLQVAAPAYEKGCRYGANYIANSQYIFNNKNNYLSGDTIHPTAAQCKEIGHQLAAGYKTGCDIHETYTPTVTVAGNVDTLENFNIAEYVTNNMITMQFGSRYQIECGIKFTSLQTISSQNQLISICDLTGDNAVMRGGVADTGVVIQCWFRGDDNVPGYDNIPIRSGTAWLGISNNRLYLIPMLNVDHNSYGITMKVKEIYLSGASITFDINCQ